MSDIPEHVNGGRRLRRVEGVLAQEAHGETVLLRLSDGAYYTTGAVGARVWELCDGTRGIDQVISVVHAEFDAPAEVVRADVVAFARDLVAEGLLLDDDR
jgi:pyrroloquinoline quinone biosynthesis protein D